MEQTEGGGGGGGGGGRGGPGPRPPPPPQIKPCKLSSRPGPRQVSRSLRATPSHALETYRPFNNGRTRSLPVGQALSTVSKSRKQQLKQQFPYPPTRQQTILTRTERSVNGDMCYGNGHHHRHHHHNNNNNESLLYSAILQ